jgi:hypothetical protein
MHVNRLDRAGDLTAETGPAVFRIDDACLPGAIHFYNIARAELCTNAASDTHIRVYTTNHASGSVLRPKMLEHAGSVVKENVSLSTLFDWSR